MLGPRQTLLLLAYFFCGSTLARAACDDVETYLSIPDVLDSDTVLDLSGVDTIECEEYAAVSSSGEMEQVIVDGATLTLTSDSAVRFINMGFVIRSGASLVFDFPHTYFGPNSEGLTRSSYPGSFVEIEEGADVTFAGTLTAEEVANVYSLFDNDGSLEIRGDATFSDGSNVLNGNTGTVKFRGDATFQNNKFLALDNIGGYVRFSKNALFDNNAFYFDGAGGCSVYNGYEGKIVFRGDTTIQNNACSESSPVLNAADMRFYGKTYFLDNDGYYGGGGIRNTGYVNFKDDVYFTRNTASEEGGGISVDGGETIFRAGVTFDSNMADSGAAFAVTDNGSLTFRDEDSVVFVDNSVEVDEDDDNCLIGDVEDGSTVDGFPGDDICDSAT